MTLYSGDCWLFNLDLSRIPYKVVTKFSYVPGEKVYELGSSALSASMLALDGGLSLPCF